MSLAASVCDQEDLVTHRLSLDVITAWHNDIDYETMCHCVTTDTYVNVQ